MQYLSLYRVYRKLLGEEFGFRRRNINQYFLKWKKSTFLRPTTQQVCYSGKLQNATEHPSTWQNVLVIIQIFAIRPTSYLRTP